MQCMCSLGCSGFEHSRLTIHYIIRGSMVGCDSMVCSVHCGVLQVHCSSIWDYLDAALSIENE